MDVTRETSIYSIIVKSAIGFGLLLFIFFLLPSPVYSETNKDRCIGLFAEAAEHPWWKCFNEVANRFTPAMQACAEANPGFRGRSAYFACVKEAGYDAAADKCSQEDEARKRELGECANKYGVVYQRTGNPLFDREHLDFCKRMYQHSCVDYLSYDDGRQCESIQYSCALFMGDVEIETPTCTDSDGTNVYGSHVSEDTPGSITAGKVTMVDKCLSSRTLIEHGCDDNRAVTRVVDCVDNLYEGCYAGACQRERLSFFDEDGHLDNTSNRNTFENKPKPPSVDEDEPQVESKKPFPIIGGIDVGDFSEEGDATLQVFVHNGGNIGGTFTATLVGCAPFTQFPIRRESILDNQTAVININAHIKDVQDDQTKKCQVLVQDIDNAENFTTADITLNFEKFPPPVECISDDQCTARQTCHVAQGVCVRKNVCTSVVQNGSPKNLLDIVFVGDNYENDEVMRRDVQRMVGVGGTEELALFTAAPFQAYQNRMNIWMVRAPENFSGDAPNEEMAASYGADCAFADQVVMISHKNFRPYAYSSSGRSYLSLSYYGQDFNHRWGALLLHELGHAFGGLADEYVEASGGDRPGRPNCAPTREDAAFWWGGTLGTDIIAGCSYTADNFRPTEHSLMRDHLTTDEYGPVNEAWLIERLDRF